MSDQFELYDLITAKQSGGLDKFTGIELTDIILVVDAHKLKLAKTGMSRVGTVGFDIESNPTFIKGQKSKGPHLIQLATKSHVYLFHHSYLEGMKYAIEVLADKGITKLGVGIGGDRKALREKYNQDLVNCIDLGNVTKPLVKAKGIRFGVQSLVATFLNNRLSKSKRVQLSNWALLPYSDSQLLYAANDAYSLIKVWDEVSNKLITAEKRLENK